MIFYSPLTAENRLIHCSSTWSSDADIVFNVPEEHEVLRNPFVFVYENGELKKDEVYQQQLIQEYEARKSMPSISQQLTLVQEAIDDMILGA